MKQSPLYFLIYNTPDSTSIKQMSVEDCLKQYNEGDEDDETTYAVVKIPHGQLINFSFDLDIESSGEIIRLKGGEHEPVLGYDVLIKPYTEN